MLTVDEIMAEWEKFASTDDEGMTTAELATGMEKCKDSVLIMLRTLNAAGRLATGRRTTTDIAGRPSHVPVYWLK